MLKTFKPLMSMILVTPILVGFSSLLIQSSAEARTKFCNKTNTKVYVAYARGETYGGAANLPPGVGQSVSDASTEYNVEGWWGLNPGGCSVVNVEAANQVARGNNLFYVTHRYYAQSVDANNIWTNNIWRGSEQFCIKDAQFKYTRSLGGYTVKKPLICASDFRQAGFKGFTSKAINKTINLN